MDRHAASKVQDHLKEGSEKATPTTDSLPDKIGASARALFQSTVLRPSSGATLDTLASISSVVEKGDSSPSYAGSMSSTEASSSRPSSTSSSRAQNPFGVPKDSFRTHTQHGAIPDMFDLDAFLAGRTEPLIEHADKPTKTGGVHQLDANEHIGSEQQSPRPVPERQQIVRDRTIDCDQSRASFKFRGLSQAEWAGSPVGPNGAQDNFDGAEVVALLSDPSFCVDNVLLDCDSTAQVRSLRQPCSLRRPEEVVRSDIVDNNLRLIPNLRSSPAAFEEMAALMPHIDEYSQDIDLRPWLDILSNYHDEVWGDLLPLVQEARRELKPKNTGVQDSTERPALRRLQMLLGHLAH